MPLSRVLVGVLVAVLGGGACGGLAAFEGVATASGSLLVDVAWTQEVDAAGVSLLLEVGGQRVLGLAAFCAALGGPCSDGYEGLVVTVDAGDVVRLVLDAQAQSVPGATSVTLTALSFVEAGPFVDEGFAASRALRLSRDGLADDARGMALDVLADVDGDGAGEILLGLPRAGGDAGRVRLLAGQDGATVLELQGRSGSWFGASVASAGDLDGDGEAEFVAGAPRLRTAAGETGAVSAFAAASGAHVRTLLGPGGAASGFGSAVDAGGDVDGDGVPDIAVGAPDADETGTDAGRAWVFSGADGSVLHAFDGVPGEHAGFSVGLVGDTDDDGFVDVAVGAPGADVNTVDEGRLRLFSGSSGQPLAEFAGETTGLRIGHAVDGAGDFDGDGFVDMVVGAPGTGEGGDGFGLLRILGGETGNPLFSLVSPDGQWRVGEDVAGAGDVDGDGTADVLGGAPSPNSPHGRLLVGAGPFGFVILDHRGQHATELGDLGAAVAAGIDLDGDGSPDFVAGRPAFGGGVTPGGGLNVYSGNLADHVPPSLSGAGDLVAGELVTFTVGDAPPGTHAWLVAGLTFAGTPLLGGTLVPSPDALLGPLPVGADGTVEVVVPWPPTPPGVAGWLQAWVDDAGGLQGFTASGGVRLEVR